MSKAEFDLFKASSVLQIEQQEQQEYCCNKCKDSDVSDASSIYHMDEDSTDMN